MEPIIYSDSFLAMESHCDVVLTNVAETKAKEIFSKVKREVENLENLLNRFYPNSETSKLCDYEVNKWMSVSDELWEILTICYDFYQLSNGAFDISLAPLIGLFEQKEQVSRKEIMQAKEICGLQNVEFDFEKQKIRFIKEGMAFDFGGIQKGIALDRLKVIFEEEKINDAIISFNEDAVFALGKHPNGSEWPIGIRNQKNPMDFIQVLAASNQSVISVGTVERQGMRDEITRTFTISPADGEVVRSESTVSVKASSATVASFLAISWLILSENDRNILAENFKNIEVFVANYLEDDIKTSLSILNDKE